MDLKIKGKKALVCAASKGIGKAIAQSLASEGVDLFICARDKETLRSTAEEIEQTVGRPVRFQSCDLSDSTSADALIEEVQTVLGGVDILIHNVGGPKPSQVLDTSKEGWKAGYSQLFESVVGLNQAFIPKMIEKNWGRIVTITSLSVFEPIANLAVSNAMRSAVTAMLKTLSDEVASHSITINCVAPGIIHTGRTDETIAGRISKFGGTREQHLDEYIKAIPAGRLGSPEELAAAVVFLCSQQASYITGSTLCVDGGKRRSTH